MKVAPYLCRRDAGKSFTDPGSNIYLDSTVSLKPYIYSASTEDSDTTGCDACATV